MNKNLAITCIFGLIAIILGAFTTHGLQDVLTTREMSSLETGIRYSFTDNLDGSNPIGQYENNPTLKHGSIYNKDWYVFTGFTFSYTFGQIPCYCKEK